MPWPMHERDEMTAFRARQSFRVLIFAAIAAFPAAAAAAEKVDLLLVLAADVSRSVDSGKFQLQRDGYAAAISDPRVLEAIRSGRTRPHRGQLRRMVGRQARSGS